MSTALTTFPELLILRHGETEWNVKGLMQGATDSPLTAKGVRQAQDQAKILARLDFTGFQVLSSPQGRALRTAQIALGGQGHDIQIDNRLREIGVGDVIGQDRKVLAELHAGPHFLSYYDALPGGEGFQALYGRCYDLLSMLNGPSVLVCHGVTSRMLRVVALGLDISDVATVPGGQGNVHQIKDGTARVLTV